MTNNRETIETYRSAKKAALFALVVLTPLFGMAQTAPTATTTTTTTTTATTVTPELKPSGDEEIVVLSPFEVSSSQNKEGYVGSTTLAGNRLNTEIRDLGTSVSVYNSNFLKDIGATDNQSLLKYTLGTEVGGVTGNFAGAGGGSSLDDSSRFVNPGGINRVRGLTSADGTRDLFLSSIPWDGFNVDAIDLQRGPNSILFGQGSPAGIINVRTKQAEYRNSNEVTFRYDQWGSTRETVDFNRMLIKNELAIRIAAANNNTKFQQEPAFDKNNREYAALRWEPAFLKKGGARTIVKANAEKGFGRSNRPRDLPPVDEITPWFTALNKTLYNPIWMNSSSNLPNTGQAVAGNANYSPWFSANYGNIYYGGPISFFNGTSSNSILNLVVNPNTSLGIDKTGAIDRSIGGVGGTQPHSIATYSTYANKANLPFNSLAKDKMITDPSIFDFYNHLLDGPNKKEWNNYYNQNISVTQSFFNESVGFDASYNREHYKQGNVTPFSGTIFIDFYSTWGDGTNTPAGYYTDGTVNPGAGRPYIWGGGYNGESTTDRQDKRLTVFATHDFAAGHHDNILLRTLGTQTVTGLYTYDTKADFGTSWTSSTVAGDYITQKLFDNIKTSNGRFWGEFVPSRVVYLGPSLSNSTLAGGLNIPRATAVQQPKTGTFRYFDSTWNKSTDPTNANYVNPGAVWNDMSGTSAPVASTQSENPANYVGWVNKTVQVVNADDSIQSRNDLTTGRSWHNQLNKAQAVVWQGKMWDDSIIATAGWRRDTVKGDSTIWQRSGTNPNEWDPASVPYSYSTNPAVTQTSKSWSLMAHLNNLPFISGVTKSLPINISLSYNRSENFQTGTLARSFFDQPLPLPAGKTQDIGLLLETKDNKYSLRINKFVSKVAHSISDAIGQPWNYGNNIAIMAGFVNNFALNTTGFVPDGVNRGSGIISNLNATANVNDVNDPVWQYDYQPKAGQTLAQANAQEITDVTAWQTWEASPAGQAFAKAWKVQFTPTGNYWPVTVDNVHFSEDALSKGYEMEFTAQVTHNWRLTLNASKVTSVRTNIGGEPTPFGGTVADFINDFDKRMMTGPMGETRMWSARNDAGTDKDNWASYADSDWNARMAQQGSNVPENRLWHVNLITNYEFDSGLMKGFNVGGAARYSSKDILGYTPIQNVGYISYDLSKPYYGNITLDLDLWVGYSRKLGSKVDWNIQLNISNLFAGNALIPVTRQGDGSPGGYRIQPHQQVALTNTFRF